MPPNADLEQITIVGIAGSLRRESFNRKLLNAAIRYAPNGMTIVPETIDDVPFFSEDLEATDFPRSVTRIKDRIRAADGLLIVTPEYNYSIPGVLKNAIDWTSRPYGDNALEGKPLAIMGASAGRMATVRSQLALRQVAVFTQMLPLQTPELMVSFAGDKFDAEGNLRDEEIRTRITELLSAFAAWIRRLGPSAA